MPPSSSSAVNSTTPLLPSSDHPSPSHNERQNRVYHRPYPTSTSVRTGVIRRAATAGRTEQQAAVRVAAVEQIEERWAYSKPIVQLDLLWNSVLVSSAIGGLIISREETTSIPVRMWIAGYVIQCVVHMISTWMEFDNRRRQQQMLSDSVDGNRDQSFNSGSGLSTSVGVNLSSASLWNDHVHVSDEDNPSVPRYIESANTMFSFIWWIIGFYWISSGGSDLENDAPYLYWLCVMFMTLDVFFVIICVFLMFLIGVALCFCLPCIIAVMALSSEQEGATSEDIARLPKFNFKKTKKTTTTGEVIKNQQQEGDEIEEWSGGELTEPEPDEGSTSATAMVLRKDDCECVICGDSYEDGCTVIRLPCNHNYHTGCIERWLHIKPLCPLCKRSIITDPYYHSSSDEAIP